MSDSNHRFTGDLLYYDSAVSSELLQAHGNVQGVGGGVTGPSRLLLQVHLPLLALFERVDNFPTLASILQGLPGTKRRSGHCASPQK